MLVVVVGDGAGGFAFFGFVFEVLALIAVGLAFANVDLDTGAFSVGAQGVDGQMRRHTQIE